MRLFVANRIGTGTKQDSFRPDIDLVDAGGSWGAYELPGGKFLCVAPNAVAAVKRSVDLGDIVGERLSGVRLNRLATATGRTTTELSNMTVGEALLLIDGSVLPDRFGRVKVCIAGVDLYDAPAVQGGATDSFTYSDGALATVSGGAWVDNTSSLSVASNQIAVGGGVEAFALAHWSTAFTTTHFSQIDITAQPVTAYYSEADAWTRMAASGITGMAGLIWNNVANVRLAELYRVVSDTFTNLYSAGPQTTATGTLRLESSGSSHSLYLDGSLLTTQTDSTHNANTLVGFGVQNTGSPKDLRVDNWVGGDLGGDAFVAPGGRRRRVHPARDGRFGRGLQRSFYRHRRSTAGAASTDFDGTATPGVIALAAALPQAVLQAGAVATPAAIAAGPVVIPPAVLQAGSVATPAVIVAGPVVIPAVTKQAGSTVSPASITVGPVIIPQAATAGGATATPAAIVLTLTLPAATTAAGSAAVPSVIPLAVTIPQASATGAAAGTASPAAITLAVSIPQAVTQGGAVVSPAVIPLSVTIPQAVTQGGAVVSPAVIPLSVTIPQASASGASTGTATPAVITTQVTIPQAAPLAGSTVAPGVIALTVTMPAALPQVSKTATPAVIPLTVTMPAAAASGATGSTATPNAIALVTVIPSPTLSFGYTVNPNVIALAVSIGAAVASGLPPDANPVTITMRDAGHTVTVRVTGTTTTVSEDGPTATVREN